MKLRLLKAYNEDMVSSMKRSFHDFYEQKGSFYLFDFPLTIEWGEAGRFQKYAREPLRYVLLDGEKPIGLFQGLVNKEVFLSPPFFISTLTAGSTCGNGMIVCPTYGPVALEFFVSAILKKERFSRASIFVPNYVKVPGLSVKKNYTFYIDLTKPIESIMSKMTKECRWAIRKAEKNMVRVEISDSDDLLEEAYSIAAQMANIKNVGIKQSRWIHELHARFKACENSVSVVARHRGEAVSAGYFLGYDKKLNWFIGGSTSKGYKLQAGNLVQMKVIEWAKNHRFRIYDMGGANPIIPRYARIHEFKSSFGGCLPTNYVLSRDEFYMPFFYESQRLESKLVRAIKKLACQKRLPIFMMSNL